MVSAVPSAIVVTPTLALAASSFARPSETFIRDHARLLAPGATVLICADAAGADRFGSPAFVEKRADHPSSRLRARLSASIAHRWAARVDPVLNSVPTSEYAPPGREEAARLGEFLLRHSPTVMLAEYGSTGIKFLDVCRRINLPLAVHFHGWDANVLGESPGIRRRYRRLFRYATRIIVTTQFLKGRVLTLGCPEEKICVCPCGIDTDTFRPATDVNGKGILMVSRLIPCKGPQLSLLSFAAIAARHPDAMLEIIGDGPLLGELQTIAAEHGILDRVTFHGARDHHYVRERMQASRLLIQHCVTIPGDGLESQGLSVLEAMSCGVPVVTTRHGAFNETVQDGVTGLLVQERDTGAMADAMDRLLSDPHLASEMGQAGRRFVVERYGQSDSIRRLQAVLGLSGAIE